MPDDTPSERIKQQAIEHNMDAQAINPPSPPDDPEPQVTQRVPSQGVRREVQEIEDRVKRAERWMIGLTAAIALSTIGGVFVGIFQWNTLHGQLGEMKSSGADTHALAEAAKTSAEAAKSAATTAAATLEAARKSFVLEQRPYLIADTPTFIRAPTADGLPVQANVTIKNIGRSPAIRHRTQRDMLRFRPLPRTKDDPVGWAMGIEKYFKFIEVAFDALNKRHDRPGGKYQPHARQDLAPGATMFITAENEAALTPAEIGDLPTGAFSLYVVGVIRYMDGFDERYETDFCYYYWFIREFSGSPGRV